MQVLPNPRETTRHHTMSILLPTLGFVLVQAFWWRGRGAQSYAALDARVLVQVGLVCLLLPALIGNGLLEEVLRLLRGRAARWFVGIYLLGLVSTLWSVHRMYSAYRAFECLVLMVVAFALVRAYGRFWPAEKRVLLALLGLGLLGVAHTARAQGISLSPGAWHSVLNGCLGAMVLSYCLAERASSRPFTRSGKKLFLVCSLLGLFLVALSSSSGTNVALVMGLGVVVFLSERRSLKVLYLLGCCAALLAVLLFGGMEFLQSVVFPGKSMESISTGHGRNVIWTLYWDRILERPWLGWGFAMLPRMVEEFYATSSHNSIIGIVGGMGVAGLLLLVLFVITYARELHAAIRTGLPGARGCLAASVVAFVNSQSNGAFGEQIGMTSIGIFLVLAFFTIFVAARQENNLRGWAGPSAPLLPHSYSSPGGRRPYGPMRKQSTKG